MTDPTLEPSAQSVPWYFLVPIAAVIISFLLGQHTERRKELGRCLGDLEDQIWEFSQRSGEYWAIPVNDSKSLALEIAMKHLSTRIGNGISRLNKHYRGFRFSNHDQLTSLRRAAMASPFEESTRQPNLQRGDAVRQESDKLVSDLYAARRSWFKFW